LQIFNPNKPQLMKTAKKIYTSIIYLIVYLKLKNSGIHKDHAKIMATEYIRFKYYYNE
jgi:hypothetical protein